MKFFTEIVDNRVLSKLIKDGAYEVEFVKKRSPEQHRFYWGLMEFFAIHANPELQLENKKDSHEFFRYRLGTKVFSAEGELVNLKPVSIKFANMPQHEFNTHFNRMFNIVCYELGTDKEAVDKMFNKFILEKKERIEKIKREVKNG
jgi:hypothetical protein